MTRRSLDPYTASPAVAPPPPRSLLSGLAPGPQVVCTLAAGGARRGAGSLARRRGPVVGAGLTSSEPLSAPSVRPICAVGPRSPFGLCSACSARPGPARVGSSAFRNLDCRGGITAAAALSRLTSPPTKLPPMAVVGGSPASPPGFFRRRSAHRRFASRQLSRAPPLRVLSLRPRRHSLPRRSLSPPAQARAHGRASLPRSPSPAFRCGAIVAVGPRSPFGACAANGPPAGSRSLR